MFSVLRLGRITLLALILPYQALATSPTLTVYTYDSFTSDWGPGPQVKKAFEAECGCVLELVGLEDGVSMLNRLKLEGKNTRADLLLGIDTNLTAEARATGLFEAHGLKLESSSLPGPWSDDLFLPYDYGYFAFVYNRERLANPPASLRQLVENEFGYRRAAHVFEGICLDTLDRVSRQPLVM